MNDLQIFTYQSSEVRTIMRNGEPWFVLKDVCIVLGIANHKNVATRLEDDEKDVVRLADPIGRMQEMTIINESGLYNVILRSDKPEAKPFRKWVTGTVLPTIRKTGTYSTNALPDGAKAALAEAKLNNSRARLASAWMKIARENPVPEYKSICAHYASAALAGRIVLPLPEAAEHTYSATEVGELLGGLSAKKVGMLANEHKLKSPEYGMEVWDKSRHSAKQVPAWRYNEKAVEKLREIMREGDAG